MQFYTILIIADVTNSVDVKPEIKTEKSESKSVPASISNFLPKGKEPIVKLEPLKQDALNLQDFNINLNSKQIVDLSKYVTLILKFKILIFSY